MPKFFFSDLSTIELYKTSVVFTNSKGFKFEQLSKILLLLSSLDFELFSIFFSFDLFSIYFYLEYNIIKLHN